MEATSESGTDCGEGGHRVPSGDRTRLVPGPCTARMKRGGMGRTMMGGGFLGKRDLQEGTLWYPGRDLTRRRDGRGISQDGRGISQDGRGISQEGLVFVEMRERFSLLDLVFRFHG